MTRRSGTGRAAGPAVGAALIALLVGATAEAHSGPPYPVVSNHVAGPYRLSV